MPDAAYEELVAIKEKHDQEKKDQEAAEVQGRIDMYNTAARNLGFPPLEGTEYPAIVEDDDNRQPHRFGEESNLEDDDDAS